MLQGVAAAIEHDRVPLPVGLKTVVDVGSHSGQFALFALERFPAARVICLEPLRGPRARLLEVTAADRDRLDVLPFVAGSRSGSVAFHVSRADDSSSVLPIGPRYVEAFPGTEEERASHAESRRLDELLPEILRPSLLKIDVQGYELEVLAGAAGRLAEIDLVLLECSFTELYLGQAEAGEVVAHLHSEGYRLTGVYGVKRDRAGNCLQADLLFDRRGSQS